HVSNGRGIVGVAPSFARSIMLGQSRRLHNRLHRPERVHAMILPPALVGAANEKSQRNQRKGQDDDRGENPLEALHARFAIGGEIRSLRLRLVNYESSANLEAGLSGEFDICNGGLSLIALGARRRFNAGGSLRHFMVVIIALLGLCGCGSPPVIRTYNTGLMN